jgi:hypothetical protein
MEYTPFSRTGQSLSTGRSPHERGLGVSFSAVVWGRVFSKAGFCNMEP